MRQTSRGCEPQVGRSGSRNKSVRLRTCAAELQWRLAVGSWAEGAAMAQAGEAPEAGLRFPPVTAGAGLINAESKVRY